MNTRITALLLTVTCLLAFAPAPAQAQDPYVPTPVTISKEKIRTNGKVYYSHVVLERQTLYSISKAYQVSVDDIYAANPTLRETGLQKNAIILIPVKAETGTEEAESPAQDAGTQVQPGTAPEASPQTPEYIEHTVKWYEGIDDIARKYGVTVEDIMNFNGLTSKKLTRKQVLRIPLRKGTEEPAVTEEKPQTPIEVVKEVFEDLTTPTPAEEEILFERKKTVETTLMLPLNASGRPSEMNMDFYAGALLAIRDMEKQGIATHLNVYDVANGVLPSQETLSSSDFILGPISSKDLSLVLNRAGSRIPVISPLDQKAASLTETYPNLIQAPSPAECQYDALAEWIAQEQQAGDKVIILSEKNVSNEAGNALVARVNARCHGASVLSYSLSEGTSIPSRLTGMLTKSGVNRIVVASDRQPFMNDVTRNMGILIGKGYEIVLYAPSKVRTFDIDNASYHQAQLHICSTYFVDYSDPAVKDFLLSYRALYNTEPSQFAFQGYDTMKYFLGLVSQYGKNWRHKLDSTTAKGLHTDFNFSGQTNVAVRRIVYRKNYTTGLDK